MSILKQFRNKKMKFDEKIDSAISKDISDVQRVIVLIDFVLEHFFHKITTTTYFLYGFYNKKQRYRRQFVGRKEMRFIFNVCNAPKDRLITGDKATFNNRYGELMGRKWLNLTNASFDEFQAFIQDMERVFVKPTDGGGGRGAGIIKIDDEMNRQAIFEELKAQKAILEGVVKQHLAMAAFHPSSINTVRIVTLRDADDVIHVMAAVMRMGTGGRVVDNFHNKGIAAAIDVESGILTSFGTDVNGRRYLFHPDTNKQIAGFQIPCWEKIINTVIGAAELLPELRYVGWDIALDSEERPIIIEANAMPDFDVLQGPGQEGLWFKYKPIIVELQRRGLSKERGKDGKVTFGKRS